MLLETSLWNATDMNLLPSSPTNKYLLQPTAPQSVNYQDLEEMRMIGLSRLTCYTPKELKLEEANNDASLLSSGKYNQDDSRNQTSSDVPNRLSS